MTLPRDRCSRSSICTSSSVRDAVVHAVNGITYTLSAGETLAILGESGSGKSVSAQAVMGIPDSPPAFITQGDIRFRGEDMLAMPEDQRRKIRGRRIAMIFQDALSALNPVFTVGDQIGEMFRVHMGMSKKESLARAADLMDRVHIPSAKQRINDYPHQFSGGMRQRVMIAMAPVPRPGRRHRRRADHGTRCHRAGADHEASQGASDRDVHGTHPDYPRPRRRGGRRGPHRGDVRRQDRRVGDVLDVYANPAHPYTRGSARVIPRVDLKGQKLTTITGQPPNLARIPSGVLVPPPLPARREDLHDRRTGAARGRLGP